MSIPMVTMWVMIGYILVPSWYMVEGTGEVGGGFGQDPSLVFRQGDQGR